MKIKLNEDVYQILMKFNRQDFMRKDIKPFLSNIPEYQIRHDSLDRFILNHLNILIEHGFLTHQRRGLTYLYSFTAAFFEQEFILTKKPKRPNITSASMQEKEEISLLKEEMIKFKSEYNELNAEIVEYKNLNKKLIQLKKPLLICLSRTMKRSNELKAKIIARESVLNLLKKLD